MSGASPPQSRKKSDMDRLLLLRALEDLGELDAPVRQFKPKRGTQPRVGEDRISGAPHGSGVVRCGNGKDAADDAGMPARCLDVPGSIRGNARAALQYCLGELKPGGLAASSHMVDAAETRKRGGGEASLQYVRENAHRSRGDLVTRGGRPDLVSDNAQLLALG